MDDFFKPIIVERIPESKSGSSSDFELVRTKRSRQIILSIEEE